MYPHSFPGSELRISRRRYGTEDLMTATEILQELATLNEIRLQEGRHKPGPSQDEIRIHLEGYVHERLSYTMMVKRIQEDTIWDLNLK